MNVSTWHLAQVTIALPVHAAIMRRRRERMVPTELVSEVCWWVPAGRRPTIEEAEKRLELLEIHGPSPEAFAMDKPVQVSR